MRVTLTDVRRGRAAARPLLLASLLALGAAGFETAESASAQTASPKAPTSLNKSGPPRGARGAATLAEYRGRVGGAVAPLEELASGYDEVRKSEKYEVWSKEGFNSDFVSEMP